MSRHIVLLMENKVELVVVQLPSVYDCMPKFSYYIGSLRITEEDHVYAYISEFNEDPDKIMAIVEMVDRFTTLEVQ